MAPLLGSVAELFDPTPAIAGRRFAVSRSPAAVLTVYRAEHALDLARTIRTAPPGSIVRAWALDAVAPALADVTIGSGPGLRSPLLNRLHDALPPGFHGWVVLLDDDAPFTTGGVAELVAVADAAGFDLAQPAHAAGSSINHRITRRRLWSVARHVGFVEIGPVVVIAPGFRSAVLPLPEDDGMGLGTDALWARLAQAGAPFGIVDCVRVRHRGRRRGYDVTEGVERFRERLAPLGGAAAVRVTHATWRAWRRRCPWRGTQPPP